MDEHNPLPKTIEVRIMRIMPTEMEAGWVKIIFA